MDKVITIKSVEVKKTGTNEKTGKDWTLYKVLCSGDADMGEFSTFNPNYQNSEGQQMRGNFEYNEKYNNWQEVSVAKEKENEKQDELLQAIKFTAEQNKKILENQDSIINFFIDKNNESKQPTNNDRPDTPKTKNWPVK